jgi:hypothetical protein
MGSLVIARRFCGPPTTGNGGYSAGLLARELDGIVEVTLRKPPPLDRPLDLSTQGSTLELRDGAELVAEARPAELELDVPDAPAFERAAELSRRYVGFEAHPFPTCFVCGPDRAAGDGLRIFAGRDRAGEPVCAPWIPDASLADDDGVVRREFVCAALDCPGYFGGFGPDYPAALLGRITVAIHDAVRAGDACVVLGWSLGREGRKLHAATALFGPDGRPRARARQTWLVVGQRSSG